MYIKQIIIQGFKSYKDQTVIEPFSPKHNVIVGRNGSGKSNFFAAIRFVLSDSYTQLSREDRQGLLHEGAGSAVMNAYVEVIFDNSDDRFPTNTPEVILRRTIGQKKDEYSLNRKNTTKQEVMNILESAGFSRSNPYYIVPQGRVTAITNMKDAERLAMLKTVAGTEVYDSRRAESKKIMEETKVKRDKIDDLLAHIRERLGELEEEKEELRAFQDKDRERRCLEYTIHRKEQDQLQERLDELDEFRETGNDQTDENREALQDGEKELDAIDSRIAGLHQQVKLLTHEKATYKDERTEAARRKAKVESDVQAIQASHSEAQQAQTERANDLQDVQTQIKQSESNLAQLLPKYNAKREQERALKQQLQDESATVQRLYAKQGRQAQFRSKKERDDWLRKEISQVHDALATRKAVRMQTTEDISELESQIDQLESEVAELRNSIENRGDEQQNISSEVQRAKDEKERLRDQRNELWREDAKLDSVIASARNELEKAERLLSFMMDQNTSRGLTNVRKIVRQEGIEGAYGPLGELFEVPERYRTAAEVTAGASLFHYVVDNDDTAERLIKRLQHDKLGRVTFSPLNRIKLRAVEGGLPKASDSVPLLSKLNYDSKFENAMQQVFGKTIVCPNLQVAAQYARSHGVSAITPDGDRSDKKGALTGGYYDSRKSRIGAMREVMAAREGSENTEGRKEEIRGEVQKIDQRLTKATSDLQKIEQKRTQLEGGYGPLRDERRRKEQELVSRRSELDAKQTRQGNLESMMNDLGNQLSSFESELTADFKKALSNQEERQLEKLNSELPDLRKRATEVANELAELEGQKRNVEDVLNVNLRPRLDELQSRDLDGDISQDGNNNTKLKERKADLKRASKALDNLDSRVREADEQIDERQQELRTAEGDRAAKAQELDKLEQAVRNHQKNVEKNAQKKAQYQARLTDVKAQVNALGVLPELAFSAQYTNMSTNAATQRLHKVQESLKKYGHVNKKAFEQYKQFEQQRIQLEDRRKELNKSDASIEELITVLDQRKDEAIQRTFRDVSKHFSEIFEQLVPAGKGKLIIQRRSDRMANGNANGPDDGDESDEEERQRSGVENYSGVAISVSFNSKHDEQQRIQQLSGGQKSLCALGLVFAIQASDPAPFYLFDEIDANLDAQYRTSVANLLQKSAETGQFICTTFRPEMLQVAEKCYGVSFMNKASSIDVVSREQALGFVEGQLSGK